jgi:CHASE2 domain-containing sensor protein
MTGEPRTWTQKLHHYWIILPLVLILFVLAIPELENMGYSLAGSAFGSDPCELQEIDQGQFTSMLYGPLSQWALRFTPTPNIAIVYIDPKTEPGEIINNTCASRVFLSRLVEDLTYLHANVIVIDKYYGKDSCTDPDKEPTFLKTMNQSQVPIVLGQPTQKFAGSPTSEGCLALSPAVKFDDKSNVHYGLTRLNSDPLKLPLQWPVFPVGAKPGDSSLHPESADSLALVAAKQQNPNIEKDPSVVKFLKLNIHPYTTFEEIPSTNAMTVLCSVEAVRRDPRPPLGYPCKGPIPPIDNLDNNNLKLNGKIVIIGANEDENDMQPYLKGERRPGVWFHANYIQSLLDHRFLREMPINVTLTCLLFLIFGVYILFWYMEKPEHALLVGLLVLAVLIVTSLAILVSTSLFTPLWALWGAGILVVFRYLEARAHHLASHLVPKKQHIHIGKRTPKP